MHKYIARVMAAGAACVVLSTGALARAGVSPEVPIAALAGKMASGGASLAPSSPGSLLWAARYHRSGNNSEAHAVAVSPGGGMVFVTGQSDRASSGDDYVTVAYNAATGARQWAVRYNGPGNGTDIANAVAVSPDGATVFVTGYSLGASSGYDYATVAYNAVTGAQQWVARYNGPGNGQDFAYAVAVNPTGGTVYVTGGSAGLTSGEDYATVAYNAVTGAQQWVARYSSSGNGADIANAVAVSPDGSTVFVTGSSAGGGSGADYATVAYNAVTGAQQWAARYSGSASGADVANAVAVSPGGGTVFVTGQGYQTSLGADYATIAYNAATGARLWVALYNGNPGPSLDIAYAVAVSPTGGTVYVTGGSAGLTSGEDYATVAYNAVTGARQWIARYNGPANSEDFASAAAVSPTGKTVYVTGRSTGTSSQDDYATIAYNAATGAQQWIARYNGPGNGKDAASSIAVSPTDGTVFVTGYSLGASSTYDYATLAYHR